MGEAMNKEEMMKKKIQDMEHEVWGCATLNPKWCKTCLYVKKSKDNKKKLPDNAYCKMYQKPEAKPKEVLFEGKECDFYDSE